MEDQNPRIANYYNSRNGVQDKAHANQPIRTAFLLNYMKLISRLYGRAGRQLPGCHRGAALTWSDPPPSPFSARSAPSAPAGSALSDKRGANPPASPWCLLPSRKESRRCRSPRGAGGGRRRCHRSPCTPARGCPSGWAAWPSPPEPCGLPASGSGCGMGRS